MPWVHDVTILMHGLRAKSATETPSQSGRREHETPARFPSRTIEERNRLRVQEILVALHDRGSHPRRKVVLLGTQPEDHAHHAVVGQLFTPSKGHRLGPCLQSFSHAGRGRHLPGCGEAAVHNTKLLEGLPPIMFKVYSCSQAAIAPVASFRSCQSARQAVSP